MPVALPQAVDGVQSQDPIHFIPIATTVLAVAFAGVLLQRYRARRGTHLLWWSAGALVYGVGTLTEAATTLVGWQPGIFRAWYISGALLGGAPLAQGTVYLLLSRRAANRLTAVVLPVIVIAAACVVLAPLDTSLVEMHRLSGRVIEWHWVRLFSPFINLYAVTFLVGGAVVSAVRFRRCAETRHRFIGNVLIALGALLPGIGGTATRFGHVEVLYVTEFIGLILIWLGFRFNTIVLPAPGPITTPVLAA